jgi:hypothetical protein
VELSPKLSEGGFETKSKEVQKPVRNSGFFLLNLVLQIIGKSKACKLIVDKYIKSI